MWWSKPHINSCEKFLERLHMHHNGIWIMKFSFLDQMLPSIVGCSQGLESFGMPYDNLWANNAYAGIKFHQKNATTQFLFIYIYIYTRTHAHWNITSHTPSCTCEAQQLPMRMPTQTTIFRFNCKYLLSQHTKKLCTCSPQSMSCITLNTFWTHCFSHCSYDLGPFTIRVFLLAV